MNEKMKKWLPHIVSGIVFVCMIVYLIPYMILMIPHYKLENICTDYNTSVVYASYAIFIIGILIPVFWAFIVFYINFGKDRLKIEVLHLFWVFLGMIITLFCVIFLILYPNTPTNLSEMDNEKRVSIETSVCFFLSFSI